MSSFICELQSFKCIFFLCQRVKQCNKYGSQKYNKVIQDLQLHSIASLKKKKQMDACRDIWELPPLEVTPRCGRLLPWWIYLRSLLDVRA